MTPRSRTSKSNKRGSQGSDTPMLNSETDGKPDSRSSLEIAATPPKEEPSKGGLKRLFMLAKPEWGLMAIGTVALVFSTASNLVVPSLMGRLIDAVTLTEGETIEQAREDLTSSVWLALIFFAVSALFSFGRATLYHIAGERFVARIRRQTYKSVIEQEIGFFDRNKTGEIVNRLAADTVFVQNAVTLNLSMGIRYFFTVVGGLVVLFLFSPALTGVMLLVVPGIAVAAVVFGRFLRKLSKQVQDALAQSGDRATEAVGNIRTVRGFAAEAREEKNYSDAIDETYRLAKKLAFGFGSFAGGVMFAGNLGIVAVLWYGGTLVIEGELTPGDLAAFLIYTITVALAFGGMANLFTTLLRAIGASERVFQLMDREPLIPVRGGKTLAKVAGHVEIKDVSFAYPSRPEITVLSNISMSLNPGKVVALVGSSGGGKSTIAHLILRFYEATRGSVTIDGEDIKVLDPAWLRQQIGIVSQEPVLFASTIEDNIRYGCPSATREEVIAAAKQANAHGFIEAFTDGYDTLVGERGVRLSGGQKQRVAIARAIIKQPAILLLDEATSALDSESEHIVQEALDRIMIGRTTLVIAHRLSTVQAADCIYVIAGGQVVESGTHLELLSREGQYKTLIARQLGGPSTSPPPTPPPPSTPAAPASLSL